MVTTEADNVFGVAVIRDDGTHFLASSEQAAPKLHWHRRDALEHQRELRSAGLKTKIVQVAMEFSYELSTSGRAK